MKEYFSKLGRSFIPAVAVMSAFAILLSFGAVFKNPAIVKIVPFLALPFFVFIADILTQLGLVVINYMPLIFAVAIAVGLTKDSDKKGISAFSAVIGYLFLLVFSSFSMKKLGIALEPIITIDDNNFFIFTQTIDMRRIMQNIVLGIQTIDLGIVGGVLVGSCSAFSTNRFSDVSLPLPISFYQGKHFPPILTALICAFLGLLAPIIWPVLGNGIYSASKIITELGLVGSFLFGFIERLLIPTGMHHIWYSLVHFTPIGGEVIINGTTYVGTKAIVTAALGTTEFSDSLHGITRLWLGQGGTPIKLFGIPGALLAVYVCAKNKPRAKAVVLSAVAATVFAGVTEPFEFLFMFLSPFLFIMHALFTGLSFFILDLVNCSYLGGSTIFDLFLNGVLQSGKSTWIPVVLLGIAMFTLYFFTFKYFITKLDIKTPGREDDDMSYEELTRSEIEASKLLIQKKDKTEVATYILKHIGGKDNIREATNCISRLRLFIKDSTLIDEIALKKTPDSLGFIKASNNEVHIVFGVKVSDYAKAVDNLLNVT